MAAACNQATVILGDGSIFINVGLALKNLDKDVANTKQVQIPPPPKTVSLSEQIPKVINTPRYDITPQFYGDF